MALIKVKDRGTDNVTGSIVQIQHEMLTTSTFSQSISGSTDSVVNNFPTVTITPTSASNKIKIECQWSGEFGNDTSETNHIFFFYRDTTKLGNTSGGSSSYTGILPGGVTYKTDAVNNASTGNFLHMAYFDTPNTTSAITYKLGVIMNAAQQVYINRTVTENDGADYENGVSWISATEIKV